MLDVLTVQLQVGEAARDREAAKNVQCSLEYTTLRRVTEATEIYYDPIPDVRSLQPVCRLSDQHSRLHVHLTLVEAAHPFTAAPNKNAAAKMVKELSSRVHDSCRLTWHLSVALSCTPDVFPHFLHLQDTYIEEDKELVQSYFELGEDEKTRRMSPWLLRIELNREMMVDKKLSMSDIAERIDREFTDELHCIFSDDNAEKLILRVCNPCQASSFS